MNFFTVSGKTLSWILTLWPPFWFTGISFRHISEDFRHVQVVLRMHFYNRNVVGVHYGGNLFSMTDPCYMMMLMRNMGKGYKVIDQGATIEFINPGLGTVTADFTIDQNLIDEIIDKTQNGEKLLQELTVDIVDEQKDIVAKVTRVIYIRKRR